MKNLKAVADYYKNNKEQTVEYAANLQKGIQQVSIATNTEQVIPANSKLLERGVAGWKQKFDMENGGRKGYPKFPMPANLDFLLNYSVLKNDKNVLDFVELTLLKMARGGIYDQLGGGFARYSVDEIWKVPHFEKMLYDNGQLISIYSKAFQQFNNEEFKTVVFETVDFIERELMDDSGAFYSALDADSDGEEGKFYVWNSTELKTILKDDYPLFSAYYQVNLKGFWEQGKSILLRDNADQKFCKKHQITEKELKEKKAIWKQKLLKIRETRVHPGLDDKTLTSWNALVISGLTDAYKVFQNNGYLQLAEKNAEFIIQNQLRENGKIYHSWKNGKTTIDGFLEDYALTIKSFIALFESTGNEKWINASRLFNNYALAHFFDEEKNLFYFSEKDNAAVVTNFFQNEDNVIPASNSVMANNLFYLFLIFGQPEYVQIAKKMVQHITPQFVNYPMAYSNWGNFMLKETEPFFEVVFSGKQALSDFAEFQRNFYPNVLFGINTIESEIPLFKNRFNVHKNQIFVCEKGVCKWPVETVSEARKLLVSQK